MKLIRRRRPSLKTALGITRLKRSIARTTGIPTTKSGRRRKAMNALTGGAYGRHQRARAAVNRPARYAKHPASCLGCVVWILGIAALFCTTLILLF